MILHAGLVTLYDRTGWRGVLIEGPSGAGKSDLALRCLALGFRLVSDDRTLVFTSGGKLFGACPEPLRGLLEARGLGLIAPPALRRVSEVSLIVSAQPEGGAIERMPDPPERRALLGVWLPVMRLQPLEASAPLKLLAALSQLGATP